MDEEDKRHEVCPIERVPGLYMTDWVGAGSVNENNILGVTHILSILTTEELEQYGPDESPEVELRHWNIKDEPSEDLMGNLTKECDWLDDVLSKYRGSDGSKGVVIVHCQQGVSRSAALIVAYLMKKFNMTFDEALADLKKTRSIVNMNPGFQEQLQSWGRSRREPGKIARPATPTGPTNALSPKSPKTPVVEIGPMDVISWRDAEADEHDKG